ncbi:helicase associated domain-containing protein [Streptomyces subrutilus]|uniref:helicase associated domain-containing protein n=1 Tax=Streptomyces subrutilus TaxID=36818 RepID=UPI003D768E67
MPDIAPGVLMDGDDLGKWLQQQKQPATWARLRPEQQERLTKLGVQPVQASSPELLYRSRAVTGAPSRPPGTRQRGNGVLGGRGATVVERWRPRLRGEVRDRCSPTLAAVTPEQHLTAHADPGPHQLALTAGIFVAPQRP